MSGYRALLVALRELDCGGKDKIVRLSSAVQTLLQQAASKTYNEHVEQVIPQFDEFLTAVSELITELVTNPDIFINHANKKFIKSGSVVTDPTLPTVISSAGICSVPGLEMGEMDIVWTDVAVLGDK